MNINDINNDGVALDGIDPVSYYDGQPLQGKSHLRFDLRGIGFLFANEGNLRIFQQDPAKYTDPLFQSYTSPIHLDIKASQRISEKRGLAMKMDETENNIPQDLKEDSSVEMQNLSDSNS